ncbi:hypothetical protein A2875_03175 [Candidatus Gottesmanbacteria bacterium RIFCSPHIGHO2_01_FULL_46_14]|uniref:Uncharacterized protein n=2 Tax=Candidatus Gottesmaniibacteriota TaxID=1752720 RepID=A0A1F5ZR69_9BACT|nr:MAG: hypothetical protein A2875_03175 [Candidatus Gottesmanbacteria bacterium RIFCSPHIGHO2_01_FULL_46_14]OGG30361.1 MAG: hypothetical protein A2971_02070 [Candidatus Gottesmanbacteria bacterium RIFCSPLOWO2_01_FULL_46_21]
MIDIADAAQKLQDAPLLKEEAVLPPPSQPADDIMNAVLDTPPPPPPSSPLPKKSRFSRMNIIVASLLFLLLTIPLAVYFVSQQRQLADTRSKAAYVTSESKLYIANLDKTSLSVIWKEQADSKGCAMAKNTQTKKETKACDDTLSRMHLITLTNLDPYTPHELSAQGGQKISLHPFFGATVISGLFDERKPPSRFVEGTIVTSGGQPLKDVFVVISPLLTDRFYFPIASKTDQQGVYSVDVSLIDAQIPASSDGYLVEVVDRLGKTLTEQKVGSASADQIPTVTVAQ